MFNAHFKKFSTNARFTKAPTSPSKTAKRIPNSSKGPLEKAALFFA